jgi:hypothetical protein
MVASNPGTKFVAKVVMGKIAGLLSRKPWECFGFLLYFLTSAILVHPSVFLRSPNLHLSVSEVPEGVFLQVFA